MARRRGKLSTPIPSTLHEAGADAELLTNAKAKIRSGDFDAVFFELCCDEQSVLSQNVISGVLAI